MSYTVCDFALQFLAHKHPIGRIYAIGILSGFDF
jgi:hypothetical protein